MTDATFPIVVKTEDGTSINCNVTSGMRILDLVNQVLPKLRLDQPVKTLAFKSAGKSLEPQRTIGDLNIVKHTVLFCEPQYSVAVFFVQTARSKLTLAYAQDARISAIKVAVQQRYFVPAAQQQLELEGRALDDRATLEDADVWPASELTLRIKSEPDQMPIFVRVDNATHLLRVTAQTTGKQLRGLVAAAAKSTEDKVLVALSNDPEAKFIEDDKTVEQMELRPEQLLCCYLRQLISVRVHLMSSENAVSIPVLQSDTIGVLKAKIREKFEGKLEALSIYPRSNWFFAGDQGFLGSVLNVHASPFKDTSILQNENIRDNGAVNALCRDSFDVKVVFPFAGGKIEDLIVHLTTLDRASEITQAIELQRLIPGSEQGALLFGTKSLQPNDFCFDVGLFHGSTVLCLHRPLAAAASGSSASSSSVAAPAPPAPVSAFATDAKSEFAPRMSRYLPAALREQVAKAREGKEKEAADARAALVAAELRRVKEAAAAAAASSTADAGSATGAESKDAGESKGDQKSSGGSGAEVKNAGGDAVLNIRTLTGKTFTVPFVESETIAQLKSRIAKVEDVAEDSMRLICAGVQLEDGTQSLTACKIGAGAQLHLVVKLRGT